jgi:hypothetical protein
MEVVVGMIHDDKMNSRFVRCLTGLIRSRDIPAALYCESGGGALDKGRNVIVQKFLQNEEAEWLLFLDTDMFFGLEAYDKLCETAQAKYPDPVSGVYFANERPPRPAMHRWDEDGHAVGITDWSEHDVLEVDGTGAGFLMVHRDVYTKMNNPDEYYGRAGSWFTQNALGPAGQLLNEDSSFCLRAQQHGYKIWVDTDVFVGHIKERVLGWE